MTSCQFFSRWRPAAILDLIWILLDHPRCVIVGLSLVLQFSIDLIYSFGDMAIFIFRHFFAGNYLFPSIFWEGGWGIFSKIWPPIVVTPKRAITAWKHVV